MNIETLSIKLLVLMLLFFVGSMETQAAVTHRTPITENKTNTTKIKGAFKDYKKQIKTARKNKRKQAKPMRPHRSMYIGGWGIAGIVLGCLVLMLVLGIVFQITWLWILATVLLAIPLILFLVLLILLLTDSDGMVC